MSTKSWEKKRKQVRVGQGYSTMIRNKQTAPPFCPPNKSTPLHWNNLWLSDLIYSDADMNHHPSKYSLLHLQYLGLQFSLVFCSNKSSVLLGAVSIWQAMKSTKAQRSFCKKWRQPRLLSIYTTSQEDSRLLSFAVTVKCAVFFSPIYFLCDDLFLG